ncbi:MAG: PrgI family protein [Candidatus Saccharimonadales bacterium]
MAVYKVIQDIESEDKLLGPLTLKGFIYAIIAGTCAFIEFKLLLIGSPLKWLFILIFAIPMILFGVLASPLGRDQPTEVWLLSRIKFFLKPHKRIWDQEGMDELVTITVPKRKEIRLTKDLTPNEVQSRLKTLALTLDTRGWAIKNVDVNLSVPEVQAKNSAVESDRLVGTAGMPQQMPVADVHAGDDIMDEKNNPTAQKFETMMKHAEAERKRDLLSSLKGLINDGDKKKPVRKHRSTSTKDLPATKAALESMVKQQAENLVHRKAKEETEVEEKLVKARAKFAKEFDRGHKKSDPAHQVVGALEPPANPVTPKAQAVNMELAQSGSAFSVATLSQLANRPMIQQAGPNEVTISLH